MVDLSIPQQILDDLVAHARELDPFECCGFLAGTNNTVTRVYRIKNVVSLDGAAQAASFDNAKIEHLSRLSPEERAEIAFIMDAQEMFQAVKDMRKQGLTLHAVYHSHPHDPARKGNGRRRCPSRRRRSASSVSTSRTRWARPP